MVAFHADEAPVRQMRAMLGDFAIEIAIATM
jgi:hypothetical protein